MRLPFKVKRGFDGREKNNLLDHPNLVAQMGTELNKSSDLYSEAAASPTLAALLKKYPIAAEIPASEKAQRKMYKNSRKLKAALLRAHPFLGGKGVSN